MPAASRALAWAPLWAPLEKTHALLLASQPLGEHDRLLTLLEESGARRRAVARGTQSPRHPWAECLLTMNRLELALEASTQRELPAVELCATEHSSLETFRRPAAGALLLHLAAAARALAHDGLERPPLFRLFSGLSEAAEGVETGAGAAGLLLYAGFWGLRLEGLLPGLERCGGCRRGLAGGAAWRRRQQKLLCHHCAGTRRLALSPEALDFARGCLRSKPAGMSGGHAPGPAARRQAAAWLDAMWQDTMDWRFGWRERAEELAGP